MRNDVSCYCPRTNRVILILDGTCFCNRISSVCQGCVFDNNHIIAGLILLLTSKLSRTKGGES